MSHPKRSIRGLTAGLAAAALALGLTLAGGSVARACPSCEGIISNADGPNAAARQSSALGAGFNYSVVFMMAMPFLLVGGFGGAVYWHLKSNPGPDINRV